MMIKMKTILSEAYAWERQDGKPLPTLKDVQEAYDAKGVDEAADGEGSLPCKDCGYTMCKCKPKTGAEDEVTEAADAKPDYIDADKDGDEKESMEKAFADKEKKDHVEEGMMCESCECDPCECDDDKTSDESVLNMSNLEESFWKRVKGNLKGHEYILREAFRK
jgi:hypothetical protein